MRPLNPSDPSRECALRILQASHLYKEFFNDFHRIMFLVTSIESDSFFKSHLNSASKSVDDRILDLRYLIQCPTRRVGQYITTFQKLLPAESAESAEYREIKSALALLTSLQHSLASSNEKKPDANVTPAKICQWLLAVNRKCADCDSPSIEYLSTTLPAILCLNCAQRHKADLPPNISLVEHISLDSVSRVTSWINHPISGDILLYASQCSNLMGHSIWEHRHPGAAKITPDSTAEERRRYIVQKYLHRAYFHPFYGHVVKIYERKGISSKKWTERFLKLEV